MSVIFKGDIIDNFGEYLPTPFIRKVDVGDENITVTLSVFLNVDEDQDVESMATALSNNLHLYLYLTVDPVRFQNVSLGKNNVLEYSQNQEVQSAFRELPFDMSDGYITIDNIFSSTSDAEGNISYDYLVSKELFDESGTRVWEFRIEQTISIEDVSDPESPQAIVGLWDNYSNKIKNDFYLLEEDVQDIITTQGYDAEWPNGYESAPHYYQWKSWDGGLYIGAFSSTLNLNDEQEIIDTLQNDSLLKIKVSDVSYETVFENISFSDDYSSIYGEISMPSLVQTEYLDPHAAIYSRTPLQSLSAGYHTDSSITHEEIVDHFQGLIAGESSSTRPDLKQMTEQISYILEVYGTKADLLVQLNLLRGLFPNKSTVTPVGKLYSKFKKAIFVTNKAIKGSAALKKQQIRNPKLRDNRSRTADSYEAPTTAVDLATLESSGAEYIYPTWYISREYDPGAEIYTNYGYFFFDYEKALRRTSALAQAYDMSKLTDLFGLDFPYHTFYISEASIYRSNEYPDDGVEQKITCTMKNAGGTPSYPLTETISATGGYDPSVDSTGDIVFPYNEGITLAGAAGAGEDYGFDATSELPLLVVRKYSNSAGTGTSGIGSGYTDMPVEGYRLLMFEFQDYFRNNPPEEARYYGASITIVDSTKTLAREIKTAFKEQLDLLSEYVEAANSMCSYNNNTGEFNAFFTEALEALYLDNPETAPWHTAPPVYTVYRDLIYDTFSGDVDTIAELSSIIVENINPYTGNLESLQKFYDDMQGLYDALYDTTSGVISAKLGEYDSENETVYELAIGDGTLWTDSVAWSSPECESDSDCGTAETCVSQKCESEMTMEMAEMDADTGYGGTKCLTNDDCETAFECTGAEGTSLGECTAIMTGLY